MLPTNNKLPIYVEYMHCSKIAGLFLNRYDVLTPGEAQRVAFARIFYHMPPFVCKLQSYILPLTVCACGKVGWGHSDP